MSRSRVLLSSWIAVIGALAAGCSRAPADVDWVSHGGDSGHTQSSPLDQITPANVASLKVAWTYHAGDARPDRSQIQCNPIVVHGVLYATTPGVKVFALDAATGAQKWIFDPSKPGAEATSLGVNRGVVFWGTAPSSESSSPSDSASTRSMPGPARPSRGSAPTAAST